jgi:hypothetical protein
MLSHRENVQTSKFPRKSKEKKRNFFRKFSEGILGFDLGKKNSKLSHAYVPLMALLFLYVKLTTSTFWGHKWHSPIGSIPFHRAQKSVLIMDAARIKSITHGAV